MIMKEHEPLSKHTNFRIGGPARWFVEARSEAELMEALAFAKAQGVPTHVMGGGSNTLANDDGFAGVVIQMAMRGVKIDGTTVVVEAGAMSAMVARQTAEAGLKGMEWAISLPGTIGGAVRGNAGCFGGEMKDVTRSVRVLCDGVVKDVPGSDARFGYRESAFKHTDDIILSATLALVPDDAEALKAKLAATLEKRKASQPLYGGSAGCVFKNYDIASDDEVQRLEAAADILTPEMRTSRRVSAGWLIDQLGLKGTKIGNAQISAEHGNFIVNLGGATASDVVQLIALAKVRARNELGVQLQEEVQYLGF